MILSNDDVDLRTRFEELRVCERAGVPAFTSLLASARGGRRPSARVPALVALAAAAAAAVVLFWPQGPRGQPSAGLDAAAITTLSEWRSPTESLLRVPGEELLRTVPSLGSSILDRGALAPRPANGG